MTTKFFYILPLSLFLSTALHGQDEVSHSITFDGSGDTIDGATKSQLDEYARNYRPVHKVVSPAQTAEESERKERLEPVQRNADKGPTTAKSREHDTDDMRRFRERYSQMNKGEKVGVAIANMGTLAVSCGVNLVDVPAAAILDAFPLFSIRTCYCMGIFFLPSIVL